MLIGETLENSVKEMVQMQRRVETKLRHAL